MRLLIAAFLLCIVSHTAHAQMPSVNSDCDAGANAGSFAFGNIGSNEVAILVCDHTGKYRKWMSKTGTGAVTADNLTVTGTLGAPVANLNFTGCAADQVIQRNSANTAWECADAGSGGGVLNPADCKAGIPITYNTSIAGFVCELCVGPSIPNGQLCLSGAVYVEGEKLVSEEAPSLLTWDDAVQYCIDLDAHGYDDWYLPGSVELRDASYTLGEGTLPYTHNNYWSSSEWPGNPVTRAYRVNINTSTSSDASKNNSYGVACFRNMDLGYTQSGE